MRIDRNRQLRIDRNRQPTKKNVGQIIESKLGSIADHVERAKESKIQRHVEEKKIIACYELTKGSHQFFFPYLTEDTYMVRVLGKVVYAKDVWFNLLVNEADDETQVFDLVGVDMVQHGLLVHAEIKNKNVTLMFIIFIEDL